MNLATTTRVDQVATRIANNDPAPEVAEHARLRLAGMETRPVVRIVLD